MWIRGGGVRHTRPTCALGQWGQVFVGETVKGDEGVRGFGRHYVFDPGKLSLAMYAHRVTYKLTLIVLGWRWNYSRLQPDRHRQDSFGRTCTSTFLSRDNHT